MNMIPDLLFVPLSLVYGSLQSLDRLLKTAAQRSARRPVISVGNLSMGGTGKSPFTAYLCRLFKNRRPVILTRGYGGRAPACVLLPGSPVRGGEAGDEPEMLLNLTGCPVSVDKDRYRGSIRAERYGKLFVMDDGFQHYRLARNADILLLDTSVPARHYRLFPAGRLREPLRALRRADIIVLTRTESADPATLRMLLRALGRAGFPEDRVFTARTRTESIQDDHGRPVSRTKAGRHVTAFAGVGNFSSFKKTVKGFLPGRCDTEFLQFPDHHHYDGNDIMLLKKHARHGRSLLTTDKDAVKLRGRGLAFYALRVGIEVEDEPRFRRILDKLLGAKT